MFTIKLPSRSTDNRKFFMCPHCGGGDVFFRVSPDICGDCDGPLPNMGAMLKKRDVRIAYFTKGYLATWED
jgi:hypothetical protein